MGRMLAGLGVTEHHTCLADIPFRVLTDVNSSYPRGLTSAHARPSGLDHVMLVWVHGRDTCSHSGDTYEGLYIYRGHGCWRMFLGC